MSTFAPADPDSTPSESTAPSTESPTQQDDSSLSAEPGGQTSEEELAEALAANTTWGADDPANPDYSLADAAPAESSSSEPEEAE